MTLPAELLSLNNVLKKVNGVRFDFNAEMSRAYENIIVITADLFNDNIDTVYFLTGTCDAEQYSLWYDTSLYNFSPRILCNANFPKIQHIAPKSSHSFKAHLTRIKEGSCIQHYSPYTAIKLGFYFYSVDKTLDLTRVDSSQIFNHQLDRESNILWTEEKTINYLRQ